MMRRQSLNEEVSQLISLHHNLLIDHPSPAESSINSIQKKRNFRHPCLPTTGAAAPRRLSTRWTALPSSRPSRLSATALLPVLLPPLLQLLTNRRWSTPKRHSRSNPASSILVLGLIVLTLLLLRHQRGRNFMNLRVQPAAAAWTAAAETALAPKRKDIMPISPEGVSPSTTVLGSTSFRPLKS